MKIDVRHHLVVALGLTLAVAMSPTGPVAAATIGFEAPTYTAGNPLPAPWQTPDGNVAVGATAYTGSQGLDVYEYGGAGWMADARAIFTFPEVDQGSLSVYVRPSTDISGANFLNLAAVRLYNSMGDKAANAYFALNDFGNTQGNPAANAWDAGWWAGWSNTGAAKFQPGGWYNVTFSWDVPADQITVDVVGMGTQSGSLLSGIAPTKVVLAGGGIIGGHATFDDLTVAVPEPTGTLLFATGLTALVCWRKRRTA